MEVGLEIAWVDPVLFGVSAGPIWAVELGVFSPAGAQPASKMEAASIISRVWVYFCMETFKIMPDYTAVIPSPIFRDK